MTAESRSIRVGAALACAVALAWAPAGLPAQDSSQNEASVREMVAEIAPAVAALRGLTLRKPIEVKLLDSAQVRAHVLKELDDLPADYIENTEYVFKLLGALPERTNLRQTMVDLLTEQAAGIYDPKSGKLIVARDFALGRGLTKVILAHEICHALQDQHYHLQTLPINHPSNDDLSLATMAVLEGDATVLMSRYMTEELRSSDYMSMMNLLTVDQKMLNKAPVFLQKELLFPYLTGLEFVTHVRQSRGADSETPFRHLPVSTEQVLHPEKLRGAARDIPTTVPLETIAPPEGDGWKLVHHNVMGELQVRLLLETWRMSEVADAAAAGWDGDQYALFRNGEGYFFAWEAVWDSAADADEFASAMATMLRTKRFRMDFEEDDWTTSGTTRQWQGGGENSEVRAALVRAKGDRSTVVLTNRMDAWAK